jgi:hypothetical protein
MNVLTSRGPDAPESEPSPVTITTVSIRGCSRYKSVVKSMKSVDPGVVDCYTRRPNLSPSKSTMAAACGSDLPVIEATKVPNGLTSKSFIK